MSLHRRAPRQLTQALSQLRSELAPATVLAECQERWSAVVGELIAAEATPVSERAGVLTVSCSAAVWSQELELMSQPIVERLNAGLTHGQLNRLRCVVGSSSTAPRKS